MPEICCVQGGTLTGKHAQPLTVGLQAVKISGARLRSPLLGTYLQGKEGKALKGPSVPDITSHTVPHGLIH